jgi:hypothetical protein
MQRPIEASTALRAPFAEARGVLLDDPGAAFSAALIAEQHDRRITTELGVDLGAGASVHQEVILQLGDARSTERRVAVPVAWQAAGRERLFPAFNGQLEAFESRPGTRLRLKGTYTVPLGVIGRIGNGVVGWRLARRSIEDLLARLARRVEAEAKHRRESVRQRSAPKPSSLPAWERSELYIG